MKPAWIALATLALGLVSTASQADTRIDALLNQRSNAARTCTADRVWCIDRDKDSATVLLLDKGKYVPASKLPLQQNEDERIESEPWKSVIRIAEPDIALIGVVLTQREAYSGGGGSVSHLRLYEVGTAGSAEPKPVLDAPLGSSFMIRACFTKDDEHSRRGACHDEYNFRATISVLPNKDKREVTLLYRTRADSFPGKRNRHDDSSAAPPLRKKDMYRAVDPACSVERTLTRNPTTGAFSWNRVLPPCPDYLFLQ